MQRSQKLEIFANWLSPIALNLTMTVFPYIGAVLDRPHISHQLQWQNQLLYVSPAKKTINLNGSPSHLDLLDMSILLKSSQIISSIRSSHNLMLKTSLTEAMISTKNSSR